MKTGSISFPAKVAELRQKGRIMKKVHVFDIEGTEFPAGRKTRVIIGDNGAIHGEHFCQGYVVIYKDGYIPLHHHAAEETYTVVKGQGEMTVQGETVQVAAGDCVYIDSTKEHALRNTGEEELHMMFVYSPKTVAEHWRQEISGELK